MIEFNKKRRNNSFEIQVVDVDVDVPLNTLNICPLQYMPSFSKIQHRFYKTLLRIHFLQSSYAL